MRFPALMLVPILTLSLIAAHAASLPDTGQDLCDSGINGASTLVTCTSANTGDAATLPRQDGRFGRDAKATTGTLDKIGGGAAGFDYSKIANNGSDLGAGVGVALGTNPTDWACTRDNITGLTWEVKVNDATHLRHMNWNYTWYNSDSSTNGGNAGTASGTTNCKTAGRCDTEKFVSDVNAAALCGFHDWRMPTQREVLTLVHLGTQYPYASIDETYFPNTRDVRGAYGPVFWSGSSLVSALSDAWSVNFGFGGGTAGGGSKTHDFVYVRLVRGERF